MTNYEIIKRMSEEELVEMFYILIETFLKNISITLSEDFKIEAKYKILEFLKKEIKASNQ